MADPLLYISLPKSERSPLPIFQEKWNQIRMRFHRGNRLHDQYNFRLHDLHPATVTRYFNAVLRDQRTAFKLNLSFRFLL